VAVPVPLPDPSFSNEMLLHEDILEDRDGIEKREEKEGQRRSDMKAQSEPEVHRPQFAQ